MIVFNTMENYEITNMHSLEGSTGITEYLDKRIYENDPLYQQRLKSNYEAVQELNNYVEKYVNFHPASNYIQFFIDHSVLEDKMADFDMTLNEYLIKKISNHPLVDIGSGNMTDQMISFLKQCNPSEYIAVDKYNTGAYNEQEFFDGLDFSAKKIQDDMLLFLSKLPDNSTNIIMSGVDSSVIPNTKILEFTKNRNKKSSPTEWNYYWNTFSF